MARQAIAGSFELHLSAVEPWQGNGTSGHWRCGLPNRVWNAVRRCYDENGNTGGTAWAAHAALAEALVTFIEEGK